MSVSLTSVAAVAMIGTSFASTLPIAGIQQATIGAVTAPIGVPLTAVAGAGLGATAPAILAGATAITTPFGGPMTAALTACAMGIGPLLMTDKGSALVTGGAKKMLGNVKSGTKGLGSTITSLPSKLASGLEKTEKFSKNCEKLTKRSKEVGGKMKEFVTGPVVKSLLHNLMK